LRRLLLLTLLALPAFAAAPPKYHLRLEANGAAPFPYLARFGTVFIDVYGGGVHAETFWLNAFSRNDASEITVLNPLGRMYIDMPVASIVTTLQRLGGSRKDVSNFVPAIAPPLHGKVKDVDATRYRLLYGPDAWIDIWTTTVIPKNPQLERILYEIIAGISPNTLPAAQKIPGTPLYVELNFSHYKKLPILKLRELKMDDEGEKDALSVGSLYVKAPLADAIFK
jgi:hypothetical protein